MITLYLESFYAPLVSIFDDDVEVGDEMLLALRKDIPNDTKFITAQDL